MSTRLYVGNLSFRVTTDSVYSAPAGYGWQSREGLKAYTRAYEAPLENRSRGTQEPPPHALEAQRSRGIRPCCADSPPRMNGERRPPTRCQPNVSWQVMQQKMPQ